MKVRFVLAAALALTLLGGAVAAGADTFINDKPARVTMTADQAGTPLGTSYLRHCENDNPYPLDKLQQLAFLDNHPMKVQHDPVGFTWLDYEANEPGDPALIVRYYAGAAEPFRCMFALLQTNHPEEDASTQRFTRHGKPFTPTRDQFCYSKRPPALLPVQADHAVATLACDILVG